jgi:hypothetical protein
MMIKNLTTLFFILYCMDELLNELKKVEMEHRWWSPEVFLSLENKTLKRKVVEIIEKSTYITRIAAYGTREDIQDLTFALHDKTPMMIISVLSCLLDKMFTLETLHVPISQHIVEWYRSEGWKFPKFKCEI